MPDRTSRVRRARPGAARVSIGRIRYLGLPSPEPCEGSTPNCTAKRRISMIPSQKFGTDWPIRARNMTTLSRTEYRLTAEITPKIVARLTDSASAMNASWSVAG
jgi:hypothetical protein